MPTKLIEVTFLPAGSVAHVAPETNLMQAAIEAEADMEFICAGKGNCGKCRGQIVSGLISEPTTAEIQHLTPEELKQGIILLCQRKALGGSVAVDTLSGDAQAGNHTPGKGDITVAQARVDPWVIKKHHQIAPPTIKDNVADLDRVLHQLPRVTKVDVRLTPHVPSILREGEYNVTSVSVNDELVALEKGHTAAENYGIAFDIGTTSVAGYLLHLNTGRIMASNSATNRQRRHGADVISRIAYLLERDTGLAELKKLVSQTIDEVVQGLLKQTGVDSRHIYALTLIGNTVMSHLLLGVSPRGVATAPFVPAFTRSLTGSVAFLGLNSLPQHTQFVLLPNIAGYVGSDTVGVILATKLDQLPGNWLAVDVGTNGEIVLAANNKLLTCSTAAGPAFEGATISQGMRAEPGAICEVNIEDDVEVKVMGNVEAQGICGSGLVDTVAAMVRRGLVKKNGRIIAPDLCPGTISPQLKSRIRPDGRGYKFMLTDKVALTQKDISELQLGKGAIKAGIEVLLQQAHITSLDLDGVFMAGAFGSNLRRESVLDIGMLPQVEVQRIKSMGNAAGSGALMALLSKKQLDKAMQLPHAVKHVELSLHKEFQRTFGRAISF